MSGRVIRSIMSKSLWNSFDPLAYIEDNYLKIHDEDRNIMDALIRHYDSLPKLKDALEIGVGPNLYPVMAMLPFVDKIEGVDYSKPNILYLKRQLKKLDKNWYKFWKLFNNLSSKYRNMNLEKDLKKKLLIKRGDIFKLEEDRYDLSSMFFCAESISSDRDKFVLACRKFISSVKHSGYLIAAFMENSKGYSVGGVEFPAFSVDLNFLCRTFKQDTTNLKIKHILVAKKPLRAGYTGMLFLTANRR